ncbi:hypothetical protein [Roseburia inulinivorans]|uniref:hypothetical protein n=1 Tax=Roseburia inulinivorans TaxID=360807 RepID=UPI0020927716|nr:hypothetical protein [Roseburia inulinivorans]
MGISRIMKESAVPGARFDLVIHPTYANSNVPAPNVTIPSEYHPWDCDSNGKYYRYRYELLWKDQLYADVDFFEIEEETWESGFPSIIIRIKTRIALSIILPQRNIRKAEYTRKKYRKKVMRGMLSIMKIWSLEKQFHGNT